MNNTDEVKKAVVGRILDYQRVFGTEEGKRVLFDLMKNHYVLKPSINQNHHVTAYNEGQRNVVLSIMSELEKNPKKIEETINEHGNKQDQEPSPDILFNLYREEMNV